jgi:hypothetical protein
MTHAFLIMLLILILSTIGFAMTYKDSVWYLFLTIAILSLLSLLNIL